MSKEKSPAKKQKLSPPSKSNGMHTVYHKDGSIWAKGRMKNGVRDGYWEWFRKDGARMRSGYFKNGKQAGIWTTYDKDGKIYKVTNLDSKSKN